VRKQQNDEEEPGAVVDDKRHQGYAGKVGSGSDQFADETGERQDARTGHELEH
jgi:hypothetical protein